MYSHDDVVFRSYHNERFTHKRKVSYYVQVSSGYDLHSWISALCAFLCAGVCTHVLCSMCVRACSIYNYVCVFL